MLPNAGPEELRQWATYARSSGRVFDRDDCPRTARREYCVADAFETCADEIERPNLEQENIKEIEDAFAAMRPMYPGFSAWILENP